MNTNTEGHREASERWLNKAVQMEAEGKPTGLCNKAFDKALEYENKAIANEKIVHLRAA